MLIKSNSRKFNYVKYTLAAAFVFVVAAAGVLIFNPPVFSQVENPQGGSMGVEGQVPGPPPEDAATINTPVDGQTFSSIPVTVSGTCEPEVIVELYKNDIFAGSANCADNGTYETEIDLFIGENELMARVRDLLGQSGPDSDTITVNYEPDVEESDRTLPSQQLLLTSTVTFKGVNPDSELRFPVTLSGGEGPYAISASWGDGNNDVLSRSDTGNFDLRYTYDQPGVYRIVIKATDESESTAFLQLVAVVDGEPVEGAEDSGPTRVIEEYITWPFLVTLPLIPLAFWFGLRYEKRRIGY